MVVANRRFRQDGNCCVSTYYVAIAPNAHLRAETIASPDTLVVQGSSNALSMLSVAIQARRMYACEDFVVYDIKR